MRRIRFEDWFLVAWLLFGVFSLSEAVRLTVCHRPPQAECETIEPVAPIPRVMSADF